MMLFIASEIMFFFAFFWAFFHSSIGPVHNIGGVWPPRALRQNPDSEKLSVSICEFEPYKEKDPEENDSEDEGYEKKYTYTYTYKTNRYKDKYT
jgi:hypothetical protein